ncbi:hypothetical protein MCOR04_011076, partial [Pyricularia oryzae]
LKSRDRTARAWSRPRGSTEMSGPPPPPKEHTSRRTSTTSSNSQSNSSSHGIRIVPYTPPKIVPGQSEGWGAGRRRTSSQSSIASSSQHQQQQHQLQHQQLFNERPQSLLLQRAQAQPQPRYSYPQVQKPEPAYYQGSGDEGGRSQGNPAKLVSANRLADTKGGLVSGTKPAAPPSEPATPPPAPGTGPPLLGPRGSNFIALNAQLHEPQPPARQSSKRHLSVPASSNSVASSSSDGATGSSRPKSRRRNFVAIHSDKTFTLVPLAKTGFFDSQTNSTTSGRTSVGSHGLSSDPGSLGSRSTVTSPPLSMSTVRSSGSHEGLSDAFFSDAFSDDRPNSPASTADTIPERTHDASPPSPPATAVAQLDDDLIGPQSSSPWNYRMVGGLRKVPSTPHPTRFQPSDDRDSSLSPLLEASSTPTSDPEKQDAPPVRSLITKESFASVQTTSTFSDSANYKVYSQSSPLRNSTETLPPPSPGSPNVQLLGQSSPVSPYDSSPVRPHGSSGSEDNYVVHGEPSPSPAGPLVGRPRPKFSQESLVVPPLHPTRKKSQEKFGYYKQRSRENLRRDRPSSSRSTQSISSVIASDTARTLFAGAASILKSHSATTGEKSSSASRLQPDSWAVSPPSHSGFGKTTQSLTVPMIEPHPHQWSSQLSTVMSEDEEGSSQGGSRSLSRSTLRRGGSISGSGTGSGNASSDERRNSTGWASSTHSRQLLSISSSLAAQLEESRSQTDSLERPAAAYGRGNGYYGDRTVRELDEDGEGITDLRQLSNRPSRSGLSGFFSSSDSSRNLHSSASSRSFNSSSVPGWARVYYGSGERKQLSAPSISEMSEGSRPNSAMRADPGSPNTDHFPLNLWSPRKRVNEVQPGSAEQRPFSDTGSMEIENAPPMDDWRIRPGLRKMTSSIWSPHLRYDRRASRFNAWDPPSISWSADSHVLGRRNAQVALFVLGFIFPFAWMIAALLPLPAEPQLQMLEGDNSQSELGIPDSLRRRVTPADDIRYQSAKWWRTLNRCMSAVGLIIIGVVIGLVVVGIRQGWYQRP